GRTRPRTADAPPRLYQKTLLTTPLLQIDLRFRAGAANTGRRSLECESRRRVQSDGTTRLDGCFWTGNPAIWCEQIGGFASPPYERVCPCAVRSKALSQSWVQCLKGETGHGVRRAPLLRPLVTRGSSRARVSMRPFAPWPHRYRAAPCPALTGVSLMTPNMKGAQRMTLALLPLLFLGVQTVLGNSLDRSVDAYVHDVMAQRHIPGLALAVIRDGRLERLASFGQASLEFSVPVTPTTLFHVASVTKSFTAVGVMKLVEAGRLQLEDSIGMYLDGLPELWRGVTIVELLSHTSGLPDIVKSGSQDPIAETPEQAMSL